MSQVRVRFAPSPTGIPHIGSIRTALFNFLFAANQKGKFVLRIEDTDQKRLVPGAIEKIKESLEILNLKWDEYYLQSERVKIYHQKLEDLKKADQVYEDEGAWRFKVPKNQDLIWQDLLHGPVKFSSDVIEDFIIVKSDGFPTYHFASVVDDREMNISHVLRGDEWISSTPKHLLLYKALGWEPPKFLHLPPILSQDKKKLSKREGAKSVLEYLEEGYLSDALVNFLALLGWSPKGDQELFTLDELISQFSLERLNKNSPIFNLQKLNWFNKKYLQKLSTDDLSNKVKMFSTLFTSQGASSAASGEPRPPRCEAGLWQDSSEVGIDQKLAKIVELVRDRMTTLSDFDKVSGIFFEKGSQKPPAKSKIQNAKAAILSISNWDEESMTQVLDQWIKAHKEDPADFKNTLRLAVFADNTPPIYQSLAVLTREEVLKRIDDAIKKSK